MPCMLPADIIAKTIVFHGHNCPGLAIGIRAAELALNIIGKPQQTNMVAIAETDMCGVDAIQFITGCTYGKGNFLHRDYGKMAFSFYNGKTGKGIRALLKPDARSGTFDEMRKLMKKESAGVATKDDQERLIEVRALIQERIMSGDLEDLFEVMPLEDGLPRPARVLESLLCEECGESVMESRTRRMGGQTLCIPCFNAQEQKI